MSQKAAADFFARLDSDSDLLSRVQGARSVADVRAIASASGFDFTDEEYLEQASQPLSGDLSDDQLDQVAGGKSGGGGPVLAPSTKVSSCHYTIQTPNACPVTK